MQTQEYTLLANYLDIYRPAKTDWPTFLVRKNWPITGHLIFVSRMYAWRLEAILTAFKRYFSSWYSITLTVTISMIIPKYHPEKMKEFLCEVGKITSVENRVFFDFRWPIARTDTFEKRYFESLIITANNLRCVVGISSRYSESITLRRLLIKVWKLCTTKFMRNAVLRAFRHVLKKWNIRRLRSHTPSKFAENVFLLQFEYCPIHLA